MAKPLTALIVGAALSVGCSTASPQQPRTGINPASMMYHDAVGKIRLQGQQIKGRCEPLYVLPLGSCDGYKNCDAIANSDDNTFLLRAQGDKGYLLRFISMTGDFPAVVRTYAGEGAIPEEVADFLRPDHYSTPSAACASFPVVRVYASNKARAPSYDEKKSAMLITLNIADGSWKNNLPPEHYAPATAETAPSVQDVNQVTETTVSKETTRMTTEKPHANHGKVQRKRIKTHGVAKPHLTSVPTASRHDYNVSVGDDGVIVMKKSDWGECKLYVGDKGGLSNVYEPDLLMNPAGWLMCKTGVGLNSNNRGPIEAMRRGATDYERAEYSAMLRDTAKGVVKKSESAAPKQNTPGKISVVETPKNQPFMENLRLGRLQGKLETYCGETAYVLHRRPCGEYDACDLTIGKKKDTVNLMAFTRTDGHIVGYDATPSGVSNVYETRLDDHPLADSLSLMKDILLADCSAKAERALAPLRRDVRSDDREQFNTLFTQAVNGTAKE